MQRAIIVVPIYKQNFSIFEKISLEQLVKILGKWPIVFIMPERLRGYTPIDDKMCVYVPDNNFLGVESYSKMLLNDEFYAMFSDYEFMLIYQLDAFVFCDALDSFCNLGYDYIGAPWPSFLGRHLKYTARIGNGGLSLRKISAVRNLLSQKKQIFNKVPQFISWFNTAEDAFFGYCGYTDDIEFNVPNLKTALSFALEHDVCKTYAKLSQFKPFGCHGWYKLNYKFWKPAIETYGYFLPENGENNVTTEDLAKNYIAHYLCERKIKSGETNLVRQALLEILPIKEGQTYKIWGSGIVGRALFNIMRDINLLPAAIIDRSGIANDIGYTTQKPPSEAELRNYDSIIIIATTKYFSEISYFLNSTGMKEGKDYIGAVALFRRIAIRLYPNLEDMLLSDIKEIL